ncbi:hypothetical protein SK128_009183 [Halocaridina rubra]|uniref:Uncharacterized protein n=1 Tax=Halocaridina rubra TaxID=373956 RepID=A0AAN8XBQ8_HALRR
MQPRGNSRCLSELRHNRSPLIPIPSTLTCFPHIHPPIIQGSPYSIYLPKLRPPSSISPITSRIHHLFQQSFIIHPLHMNSSCSSSLLSHPGPYALTKAQHSLPILALTHISLDDTSFHSATLFTIYSLSNNAKHSLALLLSTPDTLPSPWQNGSVRDSASGTRGFAPRHGLRLTNL